jgi:hypothetical protein
MKELIIKALSAHFRETGANTRQLIEFFHDGWRRQIERQNLSPQISRLYQDRAIGRVSSTRIWVIVPNEVVTGSRPFLYRGRVVWTHPQMIDGEFEAAIISRHLENQLLALEG